jgi:predicted nucleic acid-binding protein
MSGKIARAVYWDSSAVLSALFDDRHSDEAQKRAHGDELHFLSTLAWAETHAVIARIERERALAAVLADAAREALERGPWRRLNVSPPWTIVRTLASK